VLAAILGLGVSGDPSDQPPAESPAPPAGSAAPPTERPATPADNGTPASDGQQVGAEDLLEISVFEIPDLTRTVRVSQQGTISLPLLGELLVQGLTPRGVETRLREELGKRYLEDPQVSVFVREHGSKKVSVLGAVGKPGVYEMLGPRNLLQVLSQAGGLTPQVGAELYVIREGSDGQIHRLPVRVMELMTNSDPALNVSIEPGDIISVPIDRTLYIYVDGAVKSPGRIEQLASRPITVLQAIAKAGGATERANLKKVQILRKDEAGSQRVIAISLQKVRDGKEADLLLRDGDVVVVPETFF
jgi:polysaccharide export outer membrane protein